MSEDILEERGLPSLNSTTTSSTLSSSATASVSSTSTSESATAAFTLFIPSSDGNKYVYHAKHAGGTVFIAVGSCLAFILLIAIVAWLIFAFSAWLSARKEYKLKEMEEKCQYDPFFFSTFHDSGDSFDSDEKSDISEKVLKEKPSTMSLYSLGSTSVLNLLNQQKSDSVADTHAAKNNNRRSMFISPTEMLQNDANRSTVWANDSASTSNLFESQVSTPIEQSCAQILNNMDGTNGLAGQTRSMYYHNNRHSGSTLDLLLNVAGSPTPHDGTAGTRDASNNKKNYRPPSMVLDQLLDQD